MTDQPEVDRFFERQMPNAETRPLSNNSADPWPAIRPPSSKPLQWEKAMVLPSVKDGTP